MSTENQNEAFVKMIAEKTLIVTVLIECDFKKLSLLKYHINVVLHKHAVIDYNTSNQRILLIKIKIKTRLTRYSYMLTASSQQTEWCDIDMILREIWIRQRAG